MAAPVTCKRQDEVYALILATMDEKLMAMEELFARKYEDNASALDKFQVYQLNSLNALNDSVKTAAKTYQVIQSKKEERAKLSSIHEDSVKRKDRELYQLETAQDVAQKQQAKITQEQKVLDAEKERATKKLAKVNKYMKLYKDCLALDVKKNKEGQLMFIFKNVNPDDPEEAYFFSLHIDDEKYIVGSCSPAIHDLNVLLDELNSKNDLGHFICEVRKRFRFIANEYCTMR